MERFEVIHDPKIVEKWVDKINTLKDILHQEQSAGIARYALGGKTEFDYVIANIFEFFDTKGDEIRHLAEYVGKNILHPPLERDTAMIVLTDQLIDLILERVIITQDDMARSVIFSTVRGYLASNVILDLWKNTFLRVVATNMATAYVQLIMHKAARMYLDGFPLNEIKKRLKTEEILKNL